MPKEIECEFYFGNLNSKLLRNIAFYPLAFSLVHGLDLSEPFAFNLWKNKRN
jgi:hypothetical protein